MPPDELPSPRSLWDETAPPAPAYSAIAGTIRTQVAVIGAGYTGLSAALHAAEAGQDAVVIDAHAPGWGASGRNGGQVIAGLKHDPDELAARFGQDMVRTVGAAPDLVFDLIARHAIDCAPLRTGWLQLAVSNPTFETLRRRTRQWRGHGADLELLDTARTAEATG